MGSEGAREGHEEEKKAALVVGMGPFDSFLLPKTSGNRTISWGEGSSHPSKAFSPGPNHLTCSASKSGSVRPGRVKKKGKVRNNQARFSRCYVGPAYSTERLRGPDKGRDEKKK